MKFSDLKKNFPGTVPPEAKKPAAPSQKEMEEKLFGKDPAAPEGAAPSQAGPEAESPGRPEGAKTGKEPGTEAFPAAQHNVRFSIKKDEIDRHALKPDFKDREAELLEKARTVYGRALHVSRETFSALNKPYAEKYFEIEYIARSLRTEIAENPFSQSMLSYLTPSSYLYSHSVNVAIIAMGASAALRMPEEEIIRMGVAGLLHDAGMTDYEALSRLEREFDERERELVRGHVAAGLEKLDRIVDFEAEAKKLVLGAVAGHHERQDGSGYPAGLSGDAIDARSGILAAADVYEAMTHKRPWREGMEPDRVIKDFVGGMRGLFDPRSLKGLIAFLSMYPAGSLVRLTTGEIAVVAAVNAKSFNRPVVKVLMDGEFNPVQGSYLDLMEYPLTGIESEVACSEFAKKNPDFYSDFCISNFWVEW